MLSFTRSSLSAALLACSLGCGEDPASIPLDHDGYTDYYHDLGAAPPLLELVRGDTAMMVVGPWTPDPGRWWWFLRGVRAEVAVMDAHYTHSDGWVLDSLFCCGHPAVPRMDTIRLVATPNTPYGAVVIHIVGSHNSPGVWHAAKSNEISLYVVLSTD